MTKSSESIKVVVPVALIDQAVAWGNRLIQLGERSPSTQTTTIPQLIEWMKKYTVKARSEDK